MRHGARAVLKWFSLLYVVLIVIQVYLAGEGIFGLNVIKHSDDCDKKGANLTRRALHRQLEDARCASRARVLPDASRRGSLPDLRADRVAPEHARPGRLDPGGDPDVRADDPARRGTLGRGAPSR